MSCMLGIEQGGGDMMTAGTMLASTLSAMKQSGSMLENCESQAGMAKMNAAINSAGALSCHSKRSSCEETCGQLQEEIIAKLKVCKVSGNVQSTMALGLLRIAAENKLKSCENLLEKELLMGSQAAITMMTTSKMANLCKEVIAASPPPVAPGIPGNDLCADASDLSNPYCRQQFCAQPGSASLPECQGANIGNQKVGSNFNGNSSFSGGGFGERGSDVDLSGLDNNNSPQGAGTNPTEITQASVANTKPGGGGGGGGGLGGGDGSGGGGAGSSGGGTAGKLKTNIFNGFSSGSGYSVSKMGFSGGGGYSNPTGRGGAGKKKNSKFDLNKFLPNGKKRPPQRRLAGLAGSGKKSPYAGKHANIWTRVSNKYKEMCITNRLWCGKK